MDPRAFTTLMFDLSLGLLNDTVWAGEMQACFSAFLLLDGFDDVAVAVAVVAFFVGVDEEHHDG